MTKAAQHRSGFIAIVGRPNVGKSTLLNRLAGRKLAIVSPKPQTTRNRIVGVLTRPDFQAAFVDTPGIHKAKGALNRHMVDTALAAVADVDAVLLLVEATPRPDGTVEVGEANEYILQRLERAGKPVVLAVNKIDNVVKPLLLPVIDLFQRRYPFAEIHPICARNGDGVDALVAGLAAMLPEGPQLFPPEMVTDASEWFLVGELVREQVLRRCREEIPYATAVVVDHFDVTERKPDRPPSPGRLGGLVRIAATIWVERESQKGIVIGKKGQMLKEIGTAARAEVERLLKAHVFLSLVVKVEPRWSERLEALRRLGYGGR